MFWFITKKGLRKILGLVEKDINSNKENIEKNSKEIDDLKLLTAELKGMIAIREHIREQDRETPRTKYHKKAHKIANKVQLVKEIEKLVNKDLSTNEMYEIIVLDKKLCKKTCFYKYLKIVREQIAQTTRTRQTN